MILIEGGGEEEMEERGREGGRKGEEREGQGEGGLKERKREYWVEASSSPKTTNHESERGRDILSLLMTKVGALDLRLRLFF